MNETNQPVPAEYWKLCRYLWERVNATPDSDKESLDVLDAVAYNLLERETEFYAIYDDDGFMWGLTEWIALKLEGIAQKDYGEGLKESHPEVFAH